MKKAKLQVFVEQNGDIPHARMLQTATGKKQGTRMKKLECNNCGFTARTAQKWLDMLEPKSKCPVCNFDELEQV